MCDNERDSISFLFLSNTIELKEACACNLLVRLRGLDSAVDLRRRKRKLTREEKTRSMPISVFMLATHVDFLSLSPPLSLTRSERVSLSALRK